MQYDCIFRQVLESCDSIRGIDATVNMLPARTKVWDTNCTWKLTSGFIWWLHSAIVNCCGTVRPNRIVMHESMVQKMKFKVGGETNEGSGYLTVMMWKDKRNLNVLTKLLFTSREYFLWWEWISETGHSKETVVAIWDNLTNLVTCQTFTPLADSTVNGQIHCFFHLLEFAILGIVNICHLRGSKLSQKLFILTLVRDLIQETQTVPQTDHKTRKQASSTSHIIRLDTRHNTHWPLARKKAGCHAWRANNKAAETKFRC